MAKINSGTLRTFALVLLGYGIGTALSALELAAYTGSSDKAFTIYVFKGLGFVAVALLLGLYLRKRKGQS